MNRTVSFYSNLLVAALSFTAPLMEGYRELWWEESNQTEAEAEVLVGMIRSDFAKLKSTDHEGMAALLDIDHVSYKTPLL